MVMVRRDRLRRRNLAGLQCPLFRTWGSVATVPTQNFPKLDLCKVEFTMEGRRPSEDRALDGVKYPPRQAVAGETLPALSPLVCRESLNVAKGT